MNRYDSVVRRFWSLGVIDVALVQPSTTIPANPGYAPLRSRMFQTNASGTFSINPNTNLILRSAGLYANLADGLVFHGATPPSPPDMLPAPQVVVQAISLDAGTALPGTSVTTVAGSSALVGVGNPFAGLVAGDFLLLQDFVTRVLAYVDDNNITVTTPPLFSATIPTGATLAKLGVVGQDSVRSIPMWSLNDMQAVDAYIVPTFGSALSMYTVLEGWVRNDVALTFDTISIDAGWVAQSSVQFSIAIDLEYTRR